MKLSEFQLGLLDALEQYDEAILPLGLYASDELVREADKPIKRTYQEWTGAIFPYLKAHGCTQGVRHPHDHFVRSTTRVPDIGEVGLQVTKYSNIKVRQYGSGFHVDKHENRRERWEQTDLSGQISALWKQPDWFTYRLNAHVLIFIGFDKTERPFERELNELEASLKWPQKDVSFHTEFWPDKAQRGFGIRVASWGRLVQPTA